MIIRTLLPLCAASALLLSGLPAQAARDGFAVVDANGTLVRSSANVSPNKHQLGSGVYIVLFDRSLSKCAFIAVPGSSGSTPPAQGFATVEPVTGGLHFAIVVNTFDASGQPADMGFHAIARC